LVEAAGDYVSSVMAANQGAVQVSVDSTSTEQHSYDQVTSENNSDCSMMINTVESRNTTCNSITELRKRHLSNVEIFATNKKLKNDGPSSVDSFSMIEMMRLLTENVQQLSNDIRQVSVRLEQRITNLEVNFENQLTEKMSKKITDIIDIKLNEKAKLVNGNTQKELQVMKGRLDEIEKNCADIKKEHSQSVVKDNPTPHKIVIKNLDYDDRETENNVITLNKVQALFNDGLTINNVEVKSVCRKVNKSPIQRPGVVIVELAKQEQKHEILKKKASLRGHRSYQKVYIENDLPADTRNFQHSIRTVLRELGKENSYNLSGYRLLPKKVAVQQVK